MCLRYGRHFNQRSRAFRHGRSGVGFGFFVRGTLVCDGRLCFAAWGQRSRSAVDAAVLRGGKEPWSGALMRLLGVLGLSSGCPFDAKHMRGIFNVEADGISRWDRASVLFNLLSVRPDVLW